MHQRDLRRQHLGDAKLDQCVRLPAANLHERPRAGDKLTDSLYKFLGFGLIAVFVNVFHTILDFLDFDLPNNNNCRQPS
jgi:hypothetical protein